MTTDTLVIGAGQAGLATAQHLRERGVEALVLDAASGPGGSWPRYYDNLTLFSPARFSSLPGRPFPGDPERYPHRDEVVEYLAGYAALLDAEIRYGHRVTSLGPADGGLVASGAGFGVQARRAIVASGSFDTPFTPTILGLDAFEGRLLHAAEYRSAAGFEGARVAVVGAGNSAIQIAVELATVAQVTVYSRGSIRWQRQRPLGRDLHWWLTRTALDRARILSRLLPPTVPVLDDGRYRSAFRAAQLDWAPMFHQVEGSHLLGDGGRRDRVDVLLFATGYRPTIAFLDATDAADGAGRPHHRGGVSTVVPGLAYVGLDRQRSVSSATLRGVGRDARAVVRQLIAR